MDLIHDQEKKDFEQYFDCTITEVHGERSAFKPSKTFTVESLTLLVETTANVYFQNPQDPHCGNGPDMVYLYTCHIDDDGLPYEVEMGYDLANDTFYFV